MRGVHFPIENSTVVETGKSGNPNMMRPRVVVETPTLQIVGLVNLQLISRAVPERVMIPIIDGQNINRSHKDWSIRGLLRL